MPSRPSTCCMDLKRQRESQHRPPRRCWAWRSLRRWLFQSIKCAKASIACFASFTPPNCFANALAFSSQAREMKQTLTHADVTVASLLRKANYTCGGFGKWGLGDVDTAGTLSLQGFDEWVGYLDQVHAHFHYPDWIWKDGEKLPFPGNDQQSGQRHLGWWQRRSTPNVEHFRPRPTRLPLRACPGGSQVFALRRHQHDFLRLPIRARPGGSQVFALHMPVSHPPLHRR